MLTSQFWARRKILVHCHQKDQDPFFDQWTISEPRRVRESGDLNSKLMGPTHVKRCQAQRGRAQHGAALRLPSTLTSVFLFQTGKMNSLLSRMPTFLQSAVRTSLSPPLQAPPPVKLNKRSWRLPHAILHSKAVLAGLFLFLFWILLLYHSEGKPIGNLQ